MMRKLIAFILILFFLPIAGSFALMNPQKPTLPFYWVIGTLTDDDGPVQGRTVILYKPDPGIDSRLEKTTDADGKFKFNIFELYYDYSVAIDFAGVANLYNLEVPREGGSTLGCERTVKLLTNQGYVDVPMALVEGEGPDWNLPRVIDTNPADNALDIAVGQDIVVTFNKAIDQNTFRLTVVPALDNLAAAWNIAGDVVTLSHDGFSDGRKEYTVTINPIPLDKPIRDLAGNNMEAAYVFSFTTVAAPPPFAELNITTVAGDLGAGTVGVAYSETVLAVGGTAPYTWSISAGALPGGLSIDADSGEITGVPNAAGDFDFTVQVVDADGSADTEELSITIDAVPPPRGTVRLTIERVPGSTDLRVGWQGANPDLYYLTGGDGTGSYTDVVGDWTAIDLNALPADITYNAGAGETFITHTDQIGLGEAEVYYKALVAGTVQDAAHPDGGTFISQAPAVGKVNVDLGGQPATAGKNLISVPFVFTDNSIPNVFGQGADSIWENGDLLQRKSSAVNTYLTVEYKDGSWIDQAGGVALPFTFDNRFGYWIVAKSNKILTLFGQVTTDDVDVEILAAPTLTEPGKTLLGMIYPKFFGLEAATLIDDGALDGDLVQYKSSSLSEAYITAELMGGEWKDQAGGNVLPADIATWKLPHGYIYVRKTNRAFTWERTFP